MDLLLDIWWRVHARDRFFARERATLPFSETHWRTCLGIVEALEATGQSQRPALLAFLRALALFHVGEVGQALELFREIEREDQVRGWKRIIRSYLASTAGGDPKTFHGTVAWVYSDGGRGEVYVEELRQKILFLPREFGRPDIRNGDSLGEFHVAFNFLGPIADPPSFRKPDPEIVRTRAGSHPEAGR